jgi:hypothetical protein
MLTRRTFLETVGSGLVVGPQLMAAETSPTRRKRLAVVTTEWRFHSHAWHMAERFLVGYPTNGRWHRPTLDVVAAYVDQRPKNDLSVKRSKEFGFPIYPTVAEALRCGGDKLAVDAVLIIGEHGDYPRNEYGQKKYPRYEFFKQVTDVFRQDGRAVPVFNDKHLSWKWEWAQEMVDISHELNFAFTAGSSLPVTWRMPAIDMPYGADVEELLSVSIGSVDSYDFHALEAIQCMAERRRGGDAAAKREWLRCRRCGATPSGKRWRQGTGRPAAGIRSSSRRACRAARLSLSLTRSVTAIRHRLKSVSGSKTRLPTATNTPTGSRQPC